MEYVTLGKTGLKISRMGFGGIPIQRIDAQGTKKLMTVMAEKALIISILPEAIRSAKALSAKDLRESGTNLFWPQRACPGQKKRWLKTLISALKISVRIILIYIRCIIRAWSSLTRSSEQTGALEALLEAKEAGKIGHIGLTAHSLEVFEKRWKWTGWKPSCSRIILLRDRAKR